MTYALLTRAPVVLLPLDLHVLGTPPAFVLSQDQTLRCIFLVWFLFYISELITKLLKILIASSYFLYSLFSKNASKVGLQNYDIFLFCANIFFSSSLFFSNRSVVYNNLRLISYSFVPAFKELIEFYSFQFPFLKGTTKIRHFF